MSKKSPYVVSSNMDPEGGWSGTVQSSVDISARGKTLADAQASVKKQLLEHAEAIRGDVDQDFPAGA